MNFDDLRRLSLKDVGNWPLVPKLLILGGVFLAIVALGALFDWKEQWDTLDRSQKEEGTLRDQYSQKKAKAINFDAYRAQLGEVEQSFGALVKQLPNRAEIDALLTDINQAGLGRGLAFELFKPSQTENFTEFYAELPVALKVTGNYHDLGAFASDVAKMPRIVLLTDVKIDPPSKEGILSMEAVAKTYRYLDEEEIAKQKKAAKEKAAKGAKK